MMTSPFARRTAYIRAYIIKLFNHTLELAKTICNGFPYFFTLHNNM
jgi:hypothetical protein